MTRNSIILALLIALMASPALGVDVMKGGLRSGITTIQPGLFQEPQATPPLEGVTGGLSGVTGGSRPVLPIELPFYFADGMDPVGSVYRVDSLTTPGTPIYTRISGQIYSFAFHPALPQKLYFVNANDVSIFRVVEISPGTWGAEELVLSWDTYVRDLAFRFDAAGVLRLYFSEATGASGNGMIYEVMGDGSVVPFYEVDLSAVGGYWVGDFAFDDAGNLYLSSGNNIPAMIYKVTMSGGSPAGAPAEIYRNDREPIAGMVVKDNSIYYANWGNKVYRLSLATGSRTVYTDSSRGWISDVGFRNVSWTTTPLLPSGFPTKTTISQGLF
jgi:hypothetical protein